MIQSVSESLNLTERKGAPIKHIATPSKEFLDALVMRGNELTSMCKRGEIVKEEITPALYDTLRKQFPDQMDELKLGCKEVLS